MTLYWEFTHFSKILEYFYYCEIKFILPSVNRVLVCCVHFGRDFKPFRARKLRRVPPYKYEKRLASSSAFFHQIAKSSQQILCGEISLPSYVQLGVK